MYHLETRLLQVTEESNSCAETVKILRILASAWSVPVMAQLNVKGEAGFNVLKRTLQDITSKTLSKTLSSLSDAGIIDRTVMPTRPPSVNYSLSQEGKDLIHILGELSYWAENRHNRTAVKEELVLNRR